MLSNGMNTINMESKIRTQNGARQVNKKPRHIKTRLHRLIITLLLTFFISTIVLFNIGISVYIRSSASAQLDYLIQTSEEMVSQVPSEVRESSHLPDLSNQRKGRLGSTGYVFVIGSDYTVLDIMQGEESTTAAIADTLKTDNINLSDLANRKVRTESSVYYISSITDYLRPDAFMIFYVDADAIIRFAGTMNMLLITIMIVLLPVSIIMSEKLSRSFTRQADNLCRKAEDIGKGNLAILPLEDGDIEFIEVSEALNKTAEELQQSRNQQTVFFQNISHELRTPLMSIRCYAEGISYGVMGPKESAGTILSETDRLSEMVENLIYISKLDSNTAKANATLHDLRETISSCVSQQRQIAASKGIEFELEFDDDPVLLSYNDNDIHQLCSNLVSNAIRYAEKTITIKCINKEDSIILSVKDDGPGIHEDDIPHIFDRFYKGKGGKHGIGLSIVESVASIYNGQVEVHNDNGACFTITFQKTESDS